MALDHSELREYTNGMLGHLAETLGEEFAPFLPNAVQAAIASCSQVPGAARVFYLRIAWIAHMLAVHVMGCLLWRKDDGVAEENSDEEGTAETKSESIGSDDEADEEVDDEDDEDASRRLNVRTGALRPQCLCLWMAAHKLC